VALGNNFKTNFLEKNVFTEFDTFPRSLQERRFRCIQISFDQFCAQMFFNLYFVIIYEIIYMQQVKR